MFPRPGGGGAPTGNAGGDLAGSTYPNPVVAAAKITLAKMANLADQRIIGNVSGGAAAPAALTAAQLLTMLGTPGGGQIARTTHLDTAALGTVFSAPTVLAPAPGVGFALQFIAALVEFVAGNPALSHYDDSFSIFYAAGGPTADAASTTCSSAINRFPAASGISYALPNTPNNVIVDRAAAENAPLVFSGANDPKIVGPIATASIGAAGLGYAIGDTGSIESTYTGDVTARYRVDTVGALGAVTAFTVTVAGSAYETFDNPLPTHVLTGVGDGNFTVNVDSIPAVAGDAFVTVLYRVAVLH